MSRYITSISRAARSFHHSSLRCSLQGSANRSPTHQLFTKCRSITTMTTDTVPAPQNAQAFFEAVEVCLIRPALQARRSRSLYLRWNNMTDTTAPTQLLQHNQRGHPIRRRNPRSRRALRQAHPYVLQHAAEPRGGADWRGAREAVGCGD